MPNKSERINRITVVLFAVFCVLLSSVPLVFEGVSNGHDLGFHLNRLVSIADGLGRGIFPVRIYDERFNNYGYGSPLFYCDFFFWIPAGLHNLLGLSYTNCWKTFLFIINVITFLTSYYSFKAISGSEQVGAVASALYCASTYRLVDLYTRSAIGESCALVFFPLVLCGFEMIRRGKDEHWLTLSIGYVGILMSHMLSFVMSMLLGTLFFLFNWNGLSKKHSLVSIVKAAVLFFGCSAWFLVPLINALALPIQAVQEYPDFYLTTLSAKDIFDVLLKGAASPETYKGLLSSRSGSSITKTPGLMLIIGSLIFLLWRLIHKDEAKKQDRFYTICFIVGWCILALMSDLIPWKELQSLPLLSIINKFQFVWRFNMLVILFLSLCAAKGIVSLFRKRWVMLLFVMIGIIAFSGVFYYTYLSQSRYYSDMNMPLQTDSLYLFQGADIESRQRFESNVEGLNIEDISTADILQFRFFKEASEGEDYYIDVPKNYYPGYIALLNGKKAKVGYSESGVVRVFVPGIVLQGTVVVKHEETPLFMISDILSIVSGIVWLANTFKERKRLYTPINADAK